MNCFLRNILISLGAAFILVLAQNLLDSDYINTFLDQNLVSLLVALLAINTASLGIVLSKIRELIDSNDGSCEFSKTKKAMLFSIKEQVFLIFLSLILLMINDSKWQVSHPKIALLIEASVVTCFTYGILILFDTAKSVFVILDFKSGNDS